MWLSENRGRFTELTDDERAALANDVGGWILVEKESLDRAFPSDGATPGEEEPELPEPLEKRK